MHHSRLTALGIDTTSVTFDATARFWTGALGRPGEPDEDGTYIQMGRSNGLDLFVQRIGNGEPRLHLDIETDDVAAEVVRLEELGASRVEQISTWWVMRDPAGNIFCVVSPQTADFPGDANRWD